jgi:heme A synthase
VNKIGLHRYAVAVSLWILILVGAGSTITTEGAALAIPDWPFAFGSVFPSGHLTGQVWVSLIHRYLAAAALVLAIGLVSLAYRGGWQGAVRKLATLSLLLLAAQIMVGGALVLWSAPDLAGLVHAALAQLTLLAAAAVAFLSWPATDAHPGYVHDYGWPSLRTLALWTPVLVFGQIMLGAMYRHHFLSLIPHMVGAMVVGGLVLLFALFTLTQCPNHEGLRTLATAVLLVLAAQVVLGVMTYMGGAASEGQSTASLWAVLVAAAHVAVGGVLLVFCSLLALQIRRCVLPKLAATGVEASS